MIPESNNFYANFSNTTKHFIRDFFMQKGWHCRKSAFEDFELSNDWAELTLEGKNEAPLLNGRVVYNAFNIDALEQMFKAAHLNFKFEFYDEEDNLIAERSNPITP